MPSELEALSKKEKSPEVVEALLIKCYPLMNQQLNKFYLYNDPDAISYAYEALYKAIITYNAEGSAKFITYATVCIYNRLGSYLRTLKNRPEEESLQAIAFRESNTELQDIIDSGVYTDKEYINKSYVAFCDDIICELIPTLKNKTHQRIIEAWRASDYTGSHTDLASELGLSQSYVSQTINIFRHTFKKKLEAIEHGK